jgi:hypothetical protein
VADNIEGAAPSGELPPVGTELFDRAKDAVQALRGRGRRANGQAGPGNTLSLRHGLRSSRLLEAPDVAAWHQDETAAITADRGGVAELSTLQRAYVRESARLEVILAALGDDLLHAGVLTGKGKMRAATSTYLQVLDRFVKVTQALGVQRVPAHVPTFAEIAAQYDHARASGAMERHDQLADNGNGAMDADRASASDVDGPEGR